MIFLRIVHSRRTPEGGDFDQCPALADMGQPEAPADQTAAWKYFLDFFRSCAGRHIKVLGRFAQQQIAHTAANDIRLKAGILQILDDFAGMRAQLFQLDAVFRFGDGNKCVDYKFLMFCRDGYRFLCFTGSLPEGFKYFPDQDKSEISKCLETA